MRAMVDRALFCLGLGLFIVGATTRISPADEPKHASLAALRADYAKRERDLDRYRIQDLFQLATSKGEDSDAAYDELLGLAISRDLYQEALPAALIRRDDHAAGLPARAMAELVSVIAKADQGKYEESLNDLARFLAENAAQVKDPNSPRLDESTAIALGEAYLQRLYNARQYGLAKKLGELVKRGLNRPGIQAHFTGRLAKLEMLGKPAPEIKGLDVDGKPISLSQFHGKVVLVDFWATWCTPWLQELPELVALAESEGKEGLVILGVNLDAEHQSVGSVEKARPIARRLLVAASIGWPNIIAAAGADGPSRTYRVTEIPSNVLIGKDGTVVGFELSGNSLKKAIAEELKK